MCGRRRKAARGRREAASEAGSEGERRVAHAVVLTGSSATLSASLRGSLPRPVSHPWALFVWLFGTGPPRRTIGSAASVSRRCSVTDATPSEKETNEPKTASKDKGSAEGDDD